MSGPSLFCGALARGVSASSSALTIDDDGVACSNAMPCLRHALLSPAAAVVCASLSVPLSTSCTARVLEDAAAPPACASDDDCGAGTACVDDVCAAKDADPLPREATSVGPEGGVVFGPDGVTLEVPAGALDGSTALTITTTTATYEYANFSPTTRLYSIEPTVTFAVDHTAKLHVPAADASASDGDVVGPRSLFLRPTPAAPTWDAIADDDGDGVFLLPRTGIFAIGVAAAEAP
jgi:hypothetical protein